MAENVQNTSSSPDGRRLVRRVIPHRGRFMQIRIYLVKLLRLFYHQNDWKFLPMSALVAGLVAMVIRETMFVTMEGTMIGSFSLTCIALWNGCFNSIQSICRERNIIKREHRSGMHISSYVIAHFLYQALLCLAQTGITIYVCQQMGVKFPAREGMFTGSKTLEIGFTIFLITFAADMLSLLISSLAHTTTAAMTVMPFILIFQLVFSGGMMSLPRWAENYTSLTISGPGLKCIAAQADYNNQPMVTGWNALFKLRKQRIDVSFTVGQLLDFLSDDSDPSVKRFRETEIEESMLYGRLNKMLKQYETEEEKTDLPAGEPAAEPDEKPDKSRIPEETKNLTVGELAGELGDNEIPEETKNLTVGELAEKLDDSGTLEERKDLIIGELTGIMDDSNTPDEKKQLIINELISLLNDTEAIEENRSVTVGEIVDFLNENEAFEEDREQKINYTTTIAELIDTFGEEEVRNLIMSRSAQASQNPDYAGTPSNVRSQWARISAYTLLYTVLAIFFLEFIDFDKR